MGSDKCSCKVMVSAVIVAAGKGIRMNDNVRKQYMTLAGRPVLAHSLTFFEECNLINKIILVLPENDYDYCRKEILPAGFEKTVRLVPGGEKRQDSVYNGLMAANENTGIVVIHDGVRPLINIEMLELCISGAKEVGACILGIPVQDTVKQVESGHIIKTLERNTLWLAQTPQAFQYEIIRKAHENARLKGYAGTDDAFLVEQMGNRVKIIKGSKNNIKITTREDLRIAEGMLRAGFD